MKNNEIIEAKKKSKQLPEKKICSKCEIEKNINQFHILKKHSKVYDFHYSYATSWCKECYTEINTYNQQKNPDKIKQYSSEWRENNKSYFKKYLRNYWLNNKEKIAIRVKGYYEKDRLSYLIYHQLRYLYKKG